MKIHEILTELELSNSKNPESLLIKLERELALIPIKPTNSINNIARFAAYLYYNQTITLTRYHTWLALWLNKQEEIESHICILLVRSLNHILFLQCSYIRFLEENEVSNNDGLHYFDPIMIQDFQDKLMQLLRRKESKKILSTIVQLSELLNQRFQDISYNEHPIFLEFNLNAVIRQLVFLQKKEKTVGAKVVDSEKLTLDDAIDAVRNIATMKSNIQKKRSKIATASASVAAGAALTATGVGAAIGMPMLITGAATIISEVDSEGVISNIRQLTRFACNSFDVVRKLFLSSSGMQDKLAYVDILMKEIHCRSSTSWNDLFSNFCERFLQDYADEEFLFKYCAIIQTLTILQYYYTVTQADAEWLTQSLRRFIDFHDTIIRHDKYKVLLDWFYLFLLKSTAWINIPSELRHKIRENSGASDMTDAALSFLSTNASTLFSPHPPNSGLPAGFVPSPRALRIKESKESFCSAFR